MKEILSNMSFAEYGIVVIGSLLGFFIGRAMQVYRQKQADAKFKAEEKAIDKAISRADLDELADMADENNLKLQAPVRSLLRKIYEEIDSAAGDCENEECSELLSDIAFKLERILKI